MLRTCLTCSKEFIPGYQCKGVYCSWKCQRARGHLIIEAVCTECRKEFTYRVSNANKPRRFCSHSCYWQNLSGSQRPEARVTLRCQECKKDFVTLRGYATSRKRFCSPGCNRKAMHRGLRKYADVACEHCGKLFYQTRPNHRFCSRLCFFDYKGPTSIETLFQQALDQADVTYEAQYPVGKYHLDFAIPALLIAIECDGEYWHNLPGMPARDRMKNGYLKMKGWQLLRFTETQILQDLDICIHKVQNLIEETTIRLSVA